MAFSVKILKDSFNKETRNRLTTWELQYPRFIHSELMTHRMFSRNSASSRAIPVEKLIQRVVDDPVVPIHWGQNQKGMQAFDEVSEATQYKAEDAWHEALDQAIAYAKLLNGLGIHKQIVNRVIEPFMFITVIMSATDDGNFFNLRYHPDAEPHIQKLAAMMWEEKCDSIPDSVYVGDWHLPLIGFPGDDVMSLEEKKKVSVGRCARVSYLTHDGKRDIQADLDLFERLKSSGHWSPFEHVAMCLNSQDYFGNFRGFYQYRKSFQGENRKEFIREVIS